MNNAIIANNVWPANIFAANRMAKLKQRIIYENNSIIINTGNKAIGHVGTKIFKNFTPLTHNPKIKIPNPNPNENHNKIIKWLVNEIPKGKILNKLPNNTHKNIDKIKLIYE